MKCLLLDHFVEEDLLSEDELNSVGSKSLLEIKRLELEHPGERQRMSVEIEGIGA